MAKGLPMAAATTLMFLALLPTLQLTEAQIGVCYGKYAGENLPSAPDVVSLYKQYGIRAMRIYDLDLDILRALQGSGIKAIIGVPNDNLQSVGTNPSAAMQFVQTYVAPFASTIKYIAVGNEVVTQKNEVAQYVGPAMQNVLNALNAANLGGFQIKVTTAIGTDMVANPFPPSNGQFNNLAFMNPVVNFLVANGSPLLVNIYTYFSFDQPLDYRLFTTSGIKFTDSNGLQYQNLFDAILDATYAALSKAGNSALSNGKGSNVKIVGGESGWKSGFGHSLAGYTNDESSDATLQNARTYYSNLINHVKGGTPLKRGQPIEMYLFEMFDEANKPGEQNFGLFHADKTPKYPGLNFS